MQRIFEIVKCLTVKAPNLRYYDLNEEVIIQYDASQDSITTKCKPGSNSTISLMKTERNGIDSERIYRVSRPTNL